jgi:hypothetical protein
MDGHDPRHAITLSSAERVSPESQAVLGQANQTNLLGIQVQIRSQHSQGTHTGFAQCGNDCAGCRGVTSVLAGRTGKIPAKLTAPNCRPTEAPAIGSAVAWASSKVLIVSPEKSWNVKTAHYQIQHHAQLSQARNPVSGQGYRG